MTSFPVIFLFGPTATGKTDLAVALAKEFDLGLISVDACQVYRGLNIGTAKPLTRVLSEFPHALIDIRDPSDIFSAGEFCRESVRSIKHYLENNQTPMLVGGSMFYFSALTNGLGASSSLSLDVRSQINEEGDRIGWRAVHEKLRNVQPEVANRIHPNDRQRIQRAMEIYEESLNRGPKCEKVTPRVPPGARIIRLGLAISNRSSLHHRIEKRVDGMLSAGLVSEVKGLLEGGVDPRTPALRSVGYRQVCEYLKGEVSQSAMRDRIIFATRRFAKRQLTWMRNTPGIVWFDGGDAMLLCHVRRYLRASLSS